MAATRPQGVGAAISIVGLVAAAFVVAPGPVAAVDTDMTISTTAIDFGQVNVGSTAQASVTLTNTGGDPFGPITIFGGAPPTAEFNASQNCQSQTLPAGGSCMVNYSFSPGSAGSFNDTSSFTLSETNSQSDGEDFSVSLAGVGFDPNATTTTEATTTTSTTTSTSTTTTRRRRRRRWRTRLVPLAAVRPTEQQSIVGGATTPTAVAATSTTTTTIVAREPLTGEVLGAPRPALVVKVDNVDAEPQSGLNQADVVFEEIVEGQATRFAAVFNSIEANPVGPIRSARTQDVAVLQSLNDPALAYSGANEGVNEALEAAGFELLSEANAGFFRRDDRSAPHNLYANIAALWPQLTSSGNAVPAFEYVAPGIAVTGTAVTFAAMMVGSYDVRWDWDATSGCSYARSSARRTNWPTGRPAPTP